MSDIGRPLTVVELQMVEGGSESDTEGTENRSGKRKKYRRSKTTSSKSHTHSCSSLCSFASSFKSVKTEQRSEPNVNYHTDKQTGDIVDLHLSLNVLARNSNDNDANTDASCDDSPKDTDAQNVSGYNSNGLKESLINVLGKLGVWTNNSKLNRVPQGQWDSNLPPDKKVSQPTTSKYFRAFSFVGNFIERFRF